MGSAAEISARAARQCLIELLRRTRIAEDHRYRRWEIQYRQIDRQVKSITDSNWRPTAKDGVALVSLTVSASIRFVLIGKRPNRQAENRKIGPFLRLLPAQCRRAAPVCASASIFDVDHIPIEVAVKCSQPPEAKIQLFLALRSKSFTIGALPVGILASPNYYEHRKSIIEAGFTAKNRIKP
jgi:hypothetical protein